MSKRVSIVKAIAEIFKSINGTGLYKTNLYSNSYAKLKFWDEIQDFPAVYVHPTNEIRDYLPGGFVWGLLDICIKVYVKNEEDSQEDLENLLIDLENCIDLNRTLVYDTTNNYETTEIQIQSITTDEGLLIPYAVGEINLQVRYQIM
ncbi:MAG: hypothetical protein EBR82_29965 [Caulobacteraceae bacterium]|nr:hypothetical protein [Caulobacteraceae bacterium]